MAADYSYDSQAQWETGDFVNCHAVDPAGKITPGVAPETLAELVADNNLAVYLRCREGTGTNVDNIATAGEDGTLSNADAWQTRADGRHYLTGRSITVPYFAGMKVVDDNDHSWSYAAQMRVRFSEFSAQVLLQRATRFKLGIDATGHPYFQNYYHIEEVDNEEHELDVEQNEWWPLSHTNLNGDTFVMTGHSGAAYELDATNGKVRFTGAAFAGTVVVDYYHHEATGWTTEADCKDDDALSLNEWHKLGVVCSNGYLSLYLDGDAVATLETYYSGNDPETDLVAACIGDWSDIMYVGKAESACLVRFPIQGSWSKEIEIGTDKTLRYLELDTAFTRLEHSISVAVAFADSAAELNYARTWSWTAQVSGTTVYFPPKLGLLHGTWMKIMISISEEDYDRDAVLVDALRMWVRVPATILYDYEQSPYSGVGIPEMGTVEDLADLIAKVKALYAITNELSREITEVRTYAERSIPGAEGIPGLPAGIGMPGKDAEVPDWADMFAGWWTGERSMESMVEWNTYSVNKLFLKVYDIHQELASHMASMQRLGDSIIDTRTQITADIATHAALDTDVHGAGASTLATDADIDAHNVNTGVHGVGVQYLAWTLQTAKSVEALLSDHAALGTGVHGAGASTLATVANIATHNAAADAHDNGAGTALYDHKILMSGVHGATAGDPLMTLADTNTAIGNHAALTTDVHGAGASTLATAANIATHAALDTGVHGVGANYVARSSTTSTVELQITAHNIAANAHSGRDWQSGSDVDGTVATHEGSATAHGRVESNFASHKDATTGIHGVGGNHVARSTQTWNTVEDLISTHEGSASAHGSVESNFASHKDDGTNIHGVADMALLATGTWVNTQISTHNVNASRHGCANIACA